MIPSLQMNRRLSKFEIWLNNIDAPEIMVLLVIIFGIIIVVGSNFAISVGLDREKQREDIAVSNLMENTL